MITSTRSMLERSRKYSASSRMPSMNMSPMALKPRMVTWSRWPSPLDRPTPGTFFSTSSMDWAPWSLITLSGTTLTVCGISRSGASIFSALLLSVAL
ncbi:hypothetical protein D9M70_497450 [compost metagenome]